MLKTILFDAVGTLLKLKQLVGQTYSDFAGRFGCRLGPEIAEIGFRRAMKSRPYPTAVGDHRDWWREVVFEVFEDGGVSSFEIDRDACFDALFNHYGTAEAWSLYPEVEKVLDDLTKAGCKLGIVSNFDRRLLQIADELGFRSRFDSITISGDVGFTKPDSRIFQRALEALESDPGETLHIGDDPACDWEGGRNAGLRVFELSRPKNNLFEALSLTE